MRYREAYERKKSFLLAFGIPFGCLTLVLIIAQFCSSYPMTMLYSDCYHQYYPFWLEFRQTLRNGDSLLWTWSVGMGMDYLSLISYYLASPLNLLGVLVPDGLTLAFFSMLVPIKLGLAGLFFAIFLNRIFDKNDLSISLFGSMYALCSWALAYQWNIMWLDTFALLPLMALGTISLLRDKKFVLYTVVLFLSIFSNYYIGLFTCIFVLLIFICYQICHWRGFGRFVADFFRIGWFTILAIGMTAILELPALAGLQNTQSSVNKFPEGFQLNITADDTILGLLDAMRQVVGNTMGGLEHSWKEGLPNLYCGVGTVILSFLFLTSKEVKLRDKIVSVVLLVFFTLSFIIRQLDYIWHGFHFTNMIPYRFSFLFSFVLLYMAYSAYLQREQFQLWQLIVAGALTGLVMICSNSISDPVFLAFNLGFIALYLICLTYFLPGEEPEEEATEEEIAQYHQHFVRKRRFGSMCLLIIFALELSMNVLNFGLRFSYTTAGNYPKGTDDAAAVLQYMEEKEAGNLFYRVETTHTQTLNDGALNDYNGITTFTSSANVRITEFMKALGYGAKNTYNRYSYEEGSPVANLFLNLKYMLERDGNVEENSYFGIVTSSGKVYLQENNYYLPLGFLTESELADLSFDQADPFQLQNAMFSAATGVDEDVWYMTEEPEVTTENVTITTLTGNRCNYTDGKSGGTVTFDFTANRDGFLCLHLDVTDKNSYTVYLNGEQLYTESMSLPQMIAVSDVSIGDTVSVVLKMKSAGEEGRMTVKAGILDANVFYSGYEVLSASTMELTEFSSTYLSGTIDCDRDGLLYTSIPQDGNWSVAVDGQDAEVRLVGNAMVAVALTKGAHTVEFTYHNPAFSLGWKISAVCAGLFVICIFLFDRKKKGKFQKK